MLTTVCHLMDCGFRVIFGYTQSDEISLLFHRDDQTFQRKERKILSVLAGEASAVFSLSLGNPAMFDARISTLPGLEQIKDYFRWRMEDASRNCLNGYCYWLLRDQGCDPGQAHSRTEGLKLSERHDLLMRHGINFNDLPAWQKRGCGVYWKTESKEGLDPRTGEKTITERRSLFTDLNLPIGDLDLFFGKAITDLEIN